MGWLGSTVATTVVATTILTTVACTFGDGGTVGSGDDDAADTSTSTDTTTTPSPTTNGAPTTQSDPTADDDGTADTSETSDDDPGPTTSDTGDTDGPVTLGPFDPPMRLDSLSQSGTNEDDPTVRSDELEIYFNGGQAENANIFVAQRETFEEDWGPPQLVQELSLPNLDETTPELSDDGLVMLLSNNASGRQDPYMSTRDDWESPWSAPTLVAALDFDGDVYGVTLFDNVVYLCWLRPSASTTDVWRARVLDLDAGEFSAPMAVDSLNSDGNDCTVAMSADRLELFVERSGVNLNAEPAYELMRSTRAAADGEWGEPQLVTELNSLRHDSDPWLSPDGRRLYFSSSREPSATIDDHDLYMATRAPL